MLSQKCKYAIRAVLYLSSVTRISGTLKSGKDVSEALKMPVAFTGKILQELAKRNIISSTKGPGGGFYLSAENLATPIIEIVKAIDGLSFFTSCGLGLVECSEERPCPIHDTFKRCRNDLLHLFNDKTIHALGKEILESDLFIVR